MNDLSYRTLDDTTAEQQLALFNSVFNKKLDAACWRRKHFSSPQGNTIFVGAFDGDRLAGINGFMPALYSSNGATYLAAQSCESAVDPDYRGRGIFSKLILKGHQVLQEQNYDFVFGYPNSNSLPGFLKLKWNKIGCLQHRFIPLDVSVHASQKIGMLGKPIGHVYNFYITARLQLLAAGKASSVRSDPAVDESFGFNCSSADHEWRLKTSNATVIAAGKVGDAKLTSNYLAIKQTVNGGAVVWDKFANKSGRWNSAAVAEVLLRLKKDGWKFANVWGSDSELRSLKGLGTSDESTHLPLLVFPFSPRAATFIDSSSLRPDFFDADTVLISAN